MSETSATLNVQEELNANLETAHSSFFTYAKNEKEAVRCSKPLTLIFCQLYSHQKAPVYNYKE